MIKFDKKDYNSLLEEIYCKFPSFQIVGERALKLGLENMLTLDSSLGNPSQAMKCVHIAGTNGKGSVSSMIASAFMECGLKVGLYTSPHLTDFRERIKINGEMVPQEWVYDFLKTRYELFESTGASFFEITTAMAFSYFAEQQVDIAVIECGLGGRLDSTNIITPLVSIITNIGFDHCQYLGNTLDAIAREKAGIIKPKVPVVIGERVQENNEPFESIALQRDSAIYFAEDLYLTELSDIYAVANRILSLIDSEKMDLKGNCQQKNIRTAATSLAMLLQSAETMQLLKDHKYTADKACRRFVKGIENAAKNTKLRGRWETLSKRPLVICDIGHNEHGMKLLMPQIKSTYNSLCGTSRFYMVFGVMKDKDLMAELPLLPKEAEYLWVNASTERAMPAEELADKMKINGFNGKIIAQGMVAETLQYLLKIAARKDFIFIGGSSYVVAEALKYFDTKKAETKK